jgi:hypothetical protein
MKAYTFFFLCLIVLAQTSLSEPLVVNGDFESSSPEGLADGWEYKPSDILKVVKDDSGNSYLRLIKNEEKYFTAKQVVELRGNWKTIMLKARMRLKGFQQNPTQRWKVAKLGIEFIQETDEDTKRLRSKGIHLTADTGDEWVYMHKLIRIPKKCIQMELVAVNEASAGEIHFDDITLTPNPEDKMLSLDIINTAGKFEVRTDEEKPIYGYRAYRGSKVQIPSDGANSYMSLTGYRESSARASTVARLDPAWKKLKITCRMRSQDLEVGFSPTHTAKLIIEFVDENEKKLDKWITPIQLKKNLPEWTDMESEFTVPEKAKGLSITPTIQQCDGRAHFDDIKVEVVE